MDIDYACNRYGYIGLDTRVFLLHFLHRVHALACGCNSISMGTHKIHVVAPYTGIVAHKGGGATAQTRMDATFYPTMPESTSQKQMGETGR